MKRVLCLRFPNWPIQWRKVDEPSGKQHALVVHAPAERAKVRVIACCRAARRHGVRIGMVLAEAQSLWPMSAVSAVRFEPHDLLADQQHLRELVGWSLQFGPWVAIDDGPAPDCLLLDVTGCGYGFGGETGIAQKMIAGLARKGYWAVVAIADTVGASWAIAHYGLSAESRAMVITEGRHEEALRPLPVEALRLPLREVNLLREVKVARIDQLLALPRADLPSRFGPTLLLHLDRALGLVPEVLKAERPADVLEKSWAFEPPVTDRYSLVGAIEEILERLLKLVPQNRLGVRQLLCSLEFTEEDAIHFPVELLRPTAALRDLMELVGLQIDRMQLPGEVSGLTVRIAALAPLEFRQDDLFGVGSKDREEATRLIERLIGRLGERAIVRPRLVPDAQPELAFRYDSCLLPSPRFEEKGRGRGVTSPRSQTPPPGPLPETGRGSPTRPIFLKKRPVPVVVVSIYPGGSPRRIHWNNRDHVVEHSWGPERIETGWWRGDEIQRDYFVVHTTQGERLWLFRDLTDGGWFVHGVFA